MIVVDIETSGVSHDCGIWQIGAINLKTMEKFFGEGRIDDEDNIQEGALKVAGKTENFFRDKKKQSQEELVKNYLSWVEQQPEKIFFGQNIYFDIGFIQAKSIKYKFHEYFDKVHGHRGQGIETLAQEKYFGIHKKYLLDDDGKDAMSLGKVLEFCGIKDPRVHIRGITGKVEKEGVPHNSIHDCKLEGECLWRLEYGKNLFPEFEKFKIPGYLERK